MLFKRKRKIVFGVFVYNKKDEERLAGLYKSERNAGDCARAMREGGFTTRIRQVGLDF